MDNSVRDAVVQLLADQLEVPAADLTDETDLIEELGFDSLDMFEVVLMLEERFESNFDASAFEDDDDFVCRQTLTLGELMQYIEKKRRV